MECTLSGHDFEECYTLKNKILTAAKEHKCSECGKAIIKGERFEFYSGKAEGVIFTCKTCLDCVSLRETFYPDGGWYAGSILDEIAENIEYNLNGEVSAECILPLTDAAKEFVFKVIEETWAGQDN